jgi:hypothetical protein
MSLRTRSHAAKEAYTETRAKLAKLRESGTMTLTGEVAQGRAEKFMNSVAYGPMCLMAAGLAGIEGFARDSASAGRLLRAIKSVGGLKPA